MVDYGDGQHTVAEEDNPEGISLEITRKKFIELGAEASSSKA